MKIFIKRNIFNDKDTQYIKDILLGVENKCSCIDKINYAIGSNSVNNDEQIQVCLISKHMETDVDYDWDENPIERSYEEEEFIPINYCPICGDKIEIIIEKLVDKTAMIKPLMNKIIELESKKYSIKNAKEKYKIANKINQIMSQ